MKTMMLKRSSLFSVFLINILIGHYMTIQTIQQNGFNVSDILYNHGLLCGPSDSKNNPWNFPNIPEKLSPCPPCSMEKSCFRFENCCPEIEVQYPCIAPIVYQPPNQTGLNDKYLIINSCPPDTESNLSNECVKLRNFTEKINNPPVTSFDTYLTYNNRFCALCNGETSFVFWELHLSPICDVQLKPYSTIDDIVKKSILNKCTLSFIPRKPTTNNPPLPCGRRNLISTCNVTATWSFYNKNIEYACQTFIFGNSFSPYQNIFCFMCNPPVLSLINGKHLLQNGRFEDACERHGILEAARPFKNIFCFLASYQNSDTFEMKSYYVHVNEANFTYYVFESESKNFQNINSSVSYHIPFKDIETCSIHYRTWEHKIICHLPIPVSVLDVNVTDFIDDFAKKRNCLRESASNVSFSMHLANSTEDLIFKNQSVVLDIQLACEQYSLYQSVVYGTNEHINVLCNFKNKKILLQYDNTITDIAEYKMDNTECQSFNCDDEQNVYPLHLFFCGCCKVRSFDYGYSNDINWDRGGIFNRKFYSPECKGPQIFDPVTNICRNIGCFAGKLLRGPTCDFILELRTYSRQFEYLLPLVFYSPDMNRLNTSLNEKLLNLTGKSSNLCLISNQQNESFYNVVVFIEAVVKSPEDILLRFLETLIKSNSSFLVSEYDYKTKFINKTTLEKCCGVSNIPLLSELLTCRHVLFLPDEYKISEDTHVASLDKFDSKIQFYEYEIDTEGHLRICEKKFFEIINNIEENLVFVWIMVGFSVVSIICLSLTFVTYCLFSKLRTLPGRNIMNLVVSLLAFNILYILVIVVDKPNTVVCQMLGILTHFFILSTFGSFTICSVHMFRIFGQGKLTTTLVSNKGKHLSLIYFLLSYGASVLIVCAHIITLYVTSGMTSTGYGRNDKCFISGIESVILTVLVPLVLTVLMNLALYIVTVLRLEKQRSVASDLTTDSKSDRSDLCIFIKLFTTTGCSWILLLVSFFIESMPLYVVITGIQSLQGLYIFVAYVCTKRIYNLYKNKFVKARTEPQKRGMKTTTTSLSLDPSFDSPKASKRGRLSRRQNKYIIQK